ncbi:TCP-1/cpn60 chaperonin family-domain-containing protein [Thelephora terrestris]|uniref:TCP-1/cpn60 chaperonin family-domain-containing protein n=1 Tax=Thelephora terrestris TaxID=56493 RepID=A0A9P6L1S7_9AGAM|nr:TCP-1/cpn60 chaperonin family-domain-containing protein [Thelephora terrestris]
MQTPVFVMNTTPELQSEESPSLKHHCRKDVIRTCLGPKAMLKMILDPMGGFCESSDYRVLILKFSSPFSLPWIFCLCLDRFDIISLRLTNDRNVILREIGVAHPAAKNTIELSRTLRTKSAEMERRALSFSLDPEILAQSLSQLERDIHQVVIISAHNKALKESLEIIKRISIPINVNDDEEMNFHRHQVRSTLMCNLAPQAVRTVAQDPELDASMSGVQSVDIKRYARVEKVPGGEIEQSRVLNGIMLNKDITHPKMRRRIAKLRTVLLDCSLEYKKGESQTNIEITNDTDWSRIQEIEEEQVKAMVDKIVELKPDLVITEEGYAQHFLYKANVSAIRRVRKSDNNRVARAIGAAIVNGIEDLQESDVLWAFLHREDRRQYFTFLDECDSPKACTILLRGPSRDILNVRSTGTLRTRCLSQET